MKGQKGIYSVSNFVGFMWHFGINFLRLKNKNWQNPPRTATIVRKTLYPV